jgi:hypothetical protein
LIFGLLRYNNAEKVVLFNDIVSTYVMRIGHSTQYSYQRLTVAFIVKIRDRLFHSWKGYSGYMLGSTM